MGANATVVGAISPVFWGDIYQNPIIEPLIEGAPSRNRPESGERALMIAMLADAISCLERAKETSRTDRVREIYALEARAATAWIESEEKNFIFNFEIVCEHLNLDASALRERIANGIGKIQPARGKSRRMKSVG